MAALPFVFPLRADYVEDPTQAIPLYAFEVTTQSQETEKEHTSSLLLVSRTLIDALTNLRRYFKYCVWDAARAQQTSTERFLIKKINLTIWVTTISPRDVYKILVDKPSEGFGSFALTSSFAVEPDGPSFYSMLDNAQLKKFVTTPLDSQLIAFFMNPSTIIKSRASKAFKTWTNSKEVLSLKRAAQNGSRIYQLEEITPLPVAPKDVSLMISTDKESSHSFVAQGYANSAAPGAKLSEEEVDALMVTIHCLAYMCNALKPIHEALHDEAILGADTYPYLKHHLTVCVFSVVFGEPASGVWFLLEREANKNVPILLEKIGVKWTEVNIESTSSDNLIKKINAPQNWLFFTASNDGAIRMLKMTSIFDGTSMPWVNVSSVFIDALSPLTYGRIDGNDETLFFPKRLAGFNRIVPYTRLAVQDKGITARLGAPLIRTPPDDDEKEDAEIWLSRFRRILALSPIANAPDLPQTIILAQIPQGNVVFQTVSLFPHYQGVEKTLAKPKVTFWGRYERNKLIGHLYTDFINRTNQVNGKAVDPKNLTAFVRDEFDAVYGIFIETGIFGGVRRLDWLRWLESCFTEFVTSLRARVNTVIARKASSPEFFVAARNLLLNYIKDVILPIGELLGQRHYVAMGYDKTVNENERDAMYEVLNSILVTVRMDARNYVKPSPQAVIDLVKGIDLRRLVRAWYNIGNIEDGAEMHFRLPTNQEEATITRLLGSLVEEELDPLVLKSVLPETRPMEPAERVKITMHEQNALNSATLWCETMKKLIESTGKKLSMQEWAVLTTHSDLLAAHNWTTWRDGGSKPLDLFGTADDARQTREEESLRSLFDGTLAGSVYAAQYRTIFKVRGVGQGELLKQLRDHSRSLSTSFKAMLADTETHAVAPVWYAALPYSPILYGFLRSKQRTDGEVDALVAQLKNNDAEALKQLVVYLKCIAKTRRLTELTMIPDAYIQNERWFDSNGAIERSFLLNEILVDNSSIVRDQIGFYMHPMHRLFVYALQNTRLELQRAVLKALPALTSINDPAYNLIDTNGDKSVQLDPVLQDALLAAWVSGGNTDADVYNAALSRLAPGTLTSMATLQQFPSYTTRVIAKKLQEDIKGDNKLAWHKKHIKGTMPASWIFNNPSYLYAEKDPMDPKDRWPLPRIIGAATSILNPVASASPNSSRGSDSSFSSDSQDDGQTQDNPNASTKKDLKDLLGMLSWLDVSSRYLFKAASNPREFLQSIVENAASVGGRIDFTISAEDRDAAFKNIDGGDPSAAVTAFDAASMLTSASAKGVATTSPRKAALAAFAISPKERLYLATQELHDHLSKGWTPLNLHSQWQKSPVTLIANEPLISIAAATTMHHERHAQEHLQPWTLDVARAERALHKWISVLKRFETAVYNGSGIYAVFLAPIQCEDYPTMPSTNGAVDTGTLDKTLEYNENNDADNMDVEEKDPPGKMTREEELAKTTIYEDSMEGMGDVVAGHNSAQNASFFEKVMAAVVPPTPQVLMPTQDKDAIVSKSPPMGATKETQGQQIIDAEFGVRPRKSLVQYAALGVNAPFNRFLQDHADSRVSAIERFHDALRDVAAASVPVLLVTEMLIRAKTLRALLDKLWRSNGTKHRTGFGIGLLTMLHKKLDPTVASRVEKSSASVRPIVNTFGHFILNSPKSPQEVESAWKTMFKEADSSSEVAALYTAYLRDVNRSADRLATLVLNENIAYPLVTREYFGSVYLKRMEDQSKILAGTKLKEYVTPFDSLRFELRSLNAPAELPLILKQRHATVWTKLKDLLDGERLNAMLPKDRDGDVRMQDVQSAHNPFTIDSQFVCRYLIVKQTLVNSTGNLEAPYAPRPTSESLLDEASQFFLQDPIVKPLFETISNDHLAILAAAFQRTSPRENSTFPLRERSNIEPLGFLIANVLATRYYPTKPEQEGAMEVKLVSDFLTKISIQTCAHLAAYVILIATNPPSDGNYSVKAPLEIVDWLHFMCAAYFVFGIVVYHEKYPKITLYDAIDKLLIWYTSN